jgi:hypothetical protein
MTKLSTEQKIAVIGLATAYAKVANFPVFAGATDQEIASLKDACDVVFASQEILEIEVLPKEGIDMVFDGLISGNIMEKNSLIQ